MKKFLSTAITTILAVTSFAVSAETITMGTGSLTGAYHTKICPAISMAVAADGITLECVNGNGTGDNFDKVASGEIDSGLGQFDVIGLKYQSDETEELEERIGTIGYLTAEALFCAAKKGGRVGSDAWQTLNDSEHFSTDERLVISTSGKSSGTYGTMTFITKSFPNVEANVKLVAKEKFKFPSELGRLRSGKRDLVCFVTVPNPEDEKIATVMEADDLHLVEFNNSSLGAVMIGTIPAYTVTDTPVSGGLKYLAGFGDKIKSIQTGVTIIVDEDKISPAAYNALAKAANNPKLLVGKDWKSKVMAYSRKAQEATADLYQAAQELRNKN